jgi:hypothetical protein
MQPSRGARIVIGVIGSGMILTLTLSPPVLGEESLRRQREQIGEVLGKPVYRDESRTGKNINLDDELHRLPVPTHHSRQRQLAGSYLVRLFSFATLVRLVPAHPVPFFLNLLGCHDFRSPAPKNYRNSATDN